MFDLLAIAAIIAGVKYGDYRTEKRLREAAAQGKGPDYGNTPPDAASHRYAGRPPQFAPEVRDLLITGSPARFKPDIAEKLAHRFATSSLESVELAGLNIGKALTYRLIPRRDGEESCLAAIFEIADKGGSISCTLSCILGHGERIVAFAPAAMPATIALNDHFAALSVKAKVPDPVTEVVATPPTPITAKKDKPNGAQKRTDDAAAEAEVIPTKTEETG